MVIDDVLEALQAHLATPIVVTPGGFITKVRPEVLRCANGEWMQLDAGMHFASAPQSDYGPYSHVTVRLAAPIEEWLKYDQHPDDNDAAYYQYVPLREVAEIVRLCGGVA